MLSSVGKSQLSAISSILVEKHADLIIGLAENLTDRVKHANEKIVLGASYLENLPAVKGLVPI
jgi:hypothetical protein